MRTTRAIKDLVLLVMLGSFSTVLWAADIPGSKDPESMKRFDGSAIVGYRAPQFDQFVLPLGKTTGVYPMKYVKSLSVEGLVSRYTYAAPLGTSTIEMYRNYKEEFKRLGIITLYEAGPGNTGSMYVMMEPIANEDNLGQLFIGSTNLGSERLLVGKSSDPSPTYALIWVGQKYPLTGTSLIADKQTFAQLVVITPKAMENKMVMSAEDMSKSLKDLGKVLLYGIYFDTDKDVLKPESAPTLQEVSRLLQIQPALKLRVVGHTDDQGSAEHNLDLSKRRAQSVASELISKYNVAAERLDSFGCGLYAPVASNKTEEGRTKNRRVELLPG
jgi:outer membrane protein OmpA-like peptidoglycan-associated protein